MQVNNLALEKFNTFTNHQSGLLVASEARSDMCDLLEHQSSDNGCAEAFELFCYRTRKWIGAFCAALGGLETLVFAGGIGESALEVRAQA